jgi:hypothetical protein
MTTKQQTERIMELRREVILLKEDLATQRHHVEAILQFVAKQWVNECKGMLRQLT